jgi:hypothetical protein
MAFSAAALLPLLLLLEPTAVPVLVLLVLLLGAG